MAKKIISLMLVACMVFTVAITASAAGVEPATGDSPITITSAKCVGRTVTVEYTVEASKKTFDESKDDVTVLFYSPVGPEGEEKYITYNDGEKEHSAIYYADQVRYDGTNKLVFSIPSSVEEGTNYNVLVGGTDIDYPALKAGVEVPKGYMLGDVEEDGEILTNDFTAVLKHCAEIALLEEGSSAALAADVTRDGEILTNDGTEILKYCAEIITSFE